jgi:hypothetical protein
MGYILPEIYQTLCSNVNQELPKVFIETGTYMGGIPHRMLEQNKSLNPFEKLYTIELGTEIAKVASKRYKLFEENNSDASLFNAHTNEKDESFKGIGEYFDGRLTLINGDSSVELEKLLENIDEPCCFWLDAHAGASKFARGEIDVPLLNELKVIKNHHIKNHVIAIDDAHLFGKTHNDADGNILCDYRDVTRDLVQERIMDINKDYEIGYPSPFGQLMVVAVEKNKIGGSQWWNE